MQYLATGATGYLEAARLGVSDADVARLRGPGGVGGRIDHAFHLAALYDMRASEEALAAANVAGTAHCLELMDALDVGCLHHVRSIAAAGRYDGVFREDMFAEAIGLDDPCFRTKHDSAKPSRSPT